MEPQAKENGIFGDITTNLVMQTKTDEGKSGYTVPIEASPGGSWGVSPHESSISIPVSVARLFQTL
jgi:hypothetical protein